MAMVLNLIVARALDGTIGHKNDIPWHHPEDLRRFKETTTGFPIIMGRKTFQSIGRPLPGRKNIVVSKRGFDVPEGVVVVDTEEAAVRAARNSDGHGEAFIIGGASLYTRYVDMGWVDRIFLTTVGLRPGGDTRWGYELEPDEWNRVSAEVIDAADGTSLLFEKYERVVR